MDQVKTFLRQCIKYRFWIAVVLSVLFPMVGYFAFSGPIAEATVKRTGEIKSANDDVAKYTASNQPVPDVTRVVVERNEVLTKDVAATQRKLYELQEPLLRWPEVVEDKFRTWGRKYPPNVDPQVVNATIGDYYNAYPDFVDRVYKTFKPWNPEDGKGIVYAPDKQVLLKPAPFTLTSDPDLGKVWAEQERLWVVTALLDVVAKVNEAANAKDWDTAWIKEIVDVDVGSLAAQDQQSMAKGVTLAVADPLLPEGATPPEAAPASDMGRTGGMPGMGGPAASAAGEVYFLKSDTPLPYKVLPVQLTVRIDQNRLTELLVALENSPMAIQVMEPEVSKPAAPVVRPVYGETTGFGAGGGGMFGGGRGMAMSFGGGEGGMPMSGGGVSQAMRGMRGSGAPMSRAGGGEGAAGFGGGGGTPAGTNLRDVDLAKKRKDKEAAAKKTAPKKAVDQFYNIIEVTIYGQARFYNTPEPIPPVDASASPGATDAAAAPAAGTASAAPPAAATPPSPAAAPAPAAPSSRDR